MVQVGNIYYFGVLGFITLLLVGIYKFLRTKSQKTQRSFILHWAFHLFALQYLRQFVYMDVGAFHCSTLENICTISSLVFPFILLIKKRTVLLDWMFFIGVIGGGLALLYPTDAIGENLIEFEPLFFYFCHLSLLGIPLITMKLGWYKPEIKNIWAIPACFMGYQVIIFLNSALVVFSGLYNKEGYTAHELFWSTQYVNYSFTFGPVPGIPIIGDVFSFLTPRFLKIDYFGIANGGEWYFPVIWLIIPSTILLGVAYTLMTIPFWVKTIKRKVKTI